MQPPSSPPPPPGGGYEPLRPNGAHGPPPAPGYGPPPPAGYGPPQQQPGATPPPPPGYGLPPGAQYPAPGYAPGYAYGAPNGYPAKKRPGTVTTIQVFIFISAAFSLLIGLAMTGIGVGSLLSGDFADEMDMEGSAPAFVAGLGAVVLAIGAFWTWLGFRAGHPGRWVMWTVVVLNSIGAFFSLISINPIALGLEIMLICFAVSGTGRQFYEGRWAPYYQL